MIQIKNTVLKNNICFQLDKKSIPITEEEAAKITDIVLDQEEIEDTMELFDIRELEFFPNLESLTLRNFDLDNYDFTTFLKLVQLREITFENCDFENSIIIASLKVQSLSLKNCNIKDLYYKPRASQVAQW